MGVVVRCLTAAFAAAVLCSAPLGAQGGTGTITGRVVDSTTQTPLPAVTVLVAGTQRGAVTDNDGAFLIPGVPAGAVTLQARRIGYRSTQQRVTVTDGGTVNVTFTLGASAVTLTPTVTVGYGTQRREAITAAVSQIDPEQANKGVVPNVNRMIEGRAAGVTVTSNSGDPGAGAQILIRGGSSIGASNEPLYVIDGVPVQNSATETNGIGIGGSSALPRSPLNLLNPNDVASITILKDASATAIYGSRASNGVVLIETKKGHAGAGTFEYQGYVASATAANRLDVLTGTEYRRFVQEQVTAGNLPQSRLDALGTANTNWEDALLRTAATTSHDLSFSGGSQDTRYRASLNYMDNQGVVINNGFKRYQGRLNGTTQSLGGKLRVGLNLTASQVQNKYLPYENSGGFEGGVFVNMVTFNPTNPVMVRDTTTGQNVFYEVGPGAQSFRNPVALARQIDDHGTTNRILGNLNTAFSILPSLTASVNVGVDRSTGLRQTYFPTASPAGAVTNGLAQNANQNVGSNTLQTLLTFDRKLLRNQEVNVVGGYEYSSYTLGGFGAQTQNFLSDAFGANNLGAGALTIKPFSFDQENRLVSFFARANYGLADRYFLTGVVRRDGSSVFGTNNKWSTFPAVSASWRISQEAFMRDRMFSDLRLRAGYGVQGNQAVRPYQSLQLLGPDPGSRYPFGTSIITGILPIQNPNPNLKWEQTKQADVALDYGFLSQRVTGSVEYYSKVTSDLLLEVAVPQPAVVPTQLQNIGKFRGHGYEASLNAQIVNQPHRNLSAGLVYSADRNRVVDLGGRGFIATGGVSGQGQSGQQAQRIMPGYALGTFYGPQFVGVNDQGQQLFNKYEVTTDANGRTTRNLVGTTTQPTGNDLVVLGNANPKYNIGLHSEARWAAFDASFLVHAEGGFKVFNGTALVYSTKGNALQGKNFLKSALNDQIGIHEPAIFSSRYIENGRFVRLQNVTVGYSFALPGGGGGGRPRMTRFYVSGDNLLLSTPYSGYDPEVFTDAGLAARGIDYLTYPRARTVTAGLSLGF